MKYFIFFLNILSLGLIAFSIFVYSKTLLPKVDATFDQEYTINLADKTLIVKDGSLLIYTKDGQELKITQENSIGSIELFKQNFKLINQQDKELLIEPIDSCNYLKIGLNSSKKFTDLVCLKEIL